MSISSKAIKAVLGTFFLVVILNALRAPRGIVELCEMLSESVEDENEDG